MLRQIVLASVCATGFAFAATAQAVIDLGGLAVDADSAINIGAENLTVDQATGTAVFTGDVVIAQGDLRMSAGQVCVVYGADTSQIARLVASGGVTFATPTDAAEAQSADYDIVSGLLTLTGDVLLTQGASAISAQEMVINISDGTATMQGRVRTVLQRDGG